MESRAVIDIRNVSKTFDTSDGSVQALATTSISVEENRFVSIVGPSGCGKTTLLKIVGGLIPPTTGDVRVAGTPVTSPREDISFVFQGAVLLPWKTAMENILLPIRVRRKVTGEDVQRAQELLEMVGLASFEKRYPNELSGGMQQRVSICRALIQNPACLLLDEPFGALDALTRENMNVFFNQLWRETGKTVIMVTHSIQEAVFLSTRVIVMSKRPGEIVDDVDVPFEREREPAIMGEERFGAVTSKIRRYFTETGHD
jgi:NitT/TauT family transport system ATP-binding protein